MGFSTDPHETPTGAASVKLHDVGQWAKIQVVRTVTEPRTEYGTDRPILKPDGKPSYQLVVWGIYRDGNARTPEGEELRDLVPGELCRIYIHGQRWGSLMEYERTSPIRVRDAGGDYLTVRYDRQVASSTRGFNARHIWMYQIDAADKGDKGVEECRALYDRLVLADMHDTPESTQGTPTGLPSSPSVPPAADDEIPF